MNIKKTVQKALHRKKRDRTMETAHHIVFFLLLILLTAALVGAVWNAFPELKPVLRSGNPDAPHGVPLENPAEVIAFKGSVIGNVTEDMMFDGAAYAVVRDEAGGIRIVYYSKGMEPCANTDAFETGFSLERGDKVIVRGKDDGRGIGVCDSDGYYLKTVELSATASEELE